MTDDWCFEVKNGIITKQKQGGYDCYQMYGISYYGSEYQEQIAKDLEKVFNSPGGKEKYWEQVILDVCKNNYKIYLRENGFHAIADNNIYLTPRIVNSPKSNAAKKDCEYVYISTAKGGKDRLQWFFSDNRISELLYSNFMITSRTLINENYIIKSIKLPKRR